MCSCFQAKGFELTYLAKVPEVKDTVHKQSLLHHACSAVVENFPQSTDLYSEIGAITRSAKVCSYCKTLKNTHTHGLTASVYKCEETESERPVIRIDLIVFKKKLLVLNLLF